MFTVRSSTRVLTLAAMSVLSHAAMNTGPKVGDRVPAFSALDQNGRSCSLKTLAGAKGVMLVFYRSADW